MKEGPVNALEYHHVHVNDEHRCRETGFVVRTEVLPLKGSLKGEVESESWEADDCLWRVLLR